MARVRDVAVRLRRRRPADLTPLAANVCRAPFTSMYLDQHGSIRACCQNSDHPLGNITEQRLRDIWEGPAARELRDAMVVHDLGLGCQFCRWQVEEGNDALVFARTFDHLQAESTEPAWPQQLELSMSNACNLQCVMCNGDWSSAIRTNREGRPPLPTVYDDQFFEDLRPFLEHVQVVKILGGEPFLGKESLRVMEMLVDMGSTAEVHVTTNGTQWSPRVERILEKLPMTIVVSLDGVDKGAYEAIRIGSDLDVVLENIERFQGYAATHGTTVNLAHCLMTSNWQGFPDFLRWAEQQRLRSYVNTVTYPTSLSMFHLPPSKLRQVVERYRAEDAALSDELDLNLSLWKDQLDRLEHRLGRLEEGEGVDYYLGIKGFALVNAEVSAGGAWARRVAEELGAEPTHLKIDLDSRIVGVVDGPAEVLGVELDAFSGQDIEALPAGFGERLGGCQISNPDVEHPDVRRWRLTFPDEGAPVVSVIVSPVRDDEGVLVEFEAYCFAEAAADAAAPPALFDEALERFRSGHPQRHELYLKVGRVAEADCLPTPLGAALDASVGRPADDLLGVLGEVLGEVERFDSEPAVADGAALYQVAFVDGQGVRSTLEALVVPTFTAGFGPADSMVLLAEVDRSPVA